jgi:hypothetical protein
VAILLLVYKGHLFDVELTQLNRPFKHLFLLAQKYVHVFLLSVVLAYTIKLTIQTFISSSPGSISLLSYFLLFLQGLSLVPYWGTRHKMLLSAHKFIVVLSTVLQHHFN